MRNRHMIYKLFFSYIWLCVLMLGISFLVADFTIDNMQKQIDEKIQKNCADIVLELDKTYIDLRKKAVKIFTIEQLSEENMMNSSYSMTRAGIDYIGNILMMDDFLADIALSYSGKVFSSQGYSRTTALLTSLGCDDVTAAQGTACLEKENVSALYLRTSLNGCILLKYPIERYEDGRENSVIFCIRMDDIYELLKPLMDQTTVGIQITFQNPGQLERIWLWGNFESGIKEIDQEEFEKMQDNNPVSVTDFSEFFGMELSVVYDAQEVYQQVLFLKRVNEWCMVIFSLLAVCLSYKISSNHYRRIYQLKESLESIGPYSGLAKKRRRENDFDTMQTMIQYIGMETERMRTERDMVREAMKQQVSMLLFYGGIQEEKSLIDMLDKCDIEFQETFYTVSCIVSGEQNRLLPHSVESLLQDHLGCISSVEGHQALILLLELPNEDFVKKQRELLAQKIQQESGELRLKISFSRVYDKILRAPEAYLEATGICEKLLNTKKQFVGYIDEVIRSGDQRIRFENGVLERFEDALMKGELKMVLNSLNILFDQVDRNEELSGENKKYLRYCIIQSILLCLNRKEEYRNTDLIREITEINIEQDDFERRIRESMSRICHQEEKGKVRFYEILEYIHSNYHRYDLSLEDVAEFAGLTSTYMSRLFKEKIGSKYIEYVTEYRMEQAQKYLIETELSINEIANMVGYSNVPNFRSKFKEFCGMSASEYRRQQKNI